jgi:putative heme degradation protein
MKEIIEEWSLYYPTEDGSRASVKGLDLGRERMASFFENRK